MYISIGIIFSVLLIVSNVYSSTIRQTTNGPVEGIVLPTILGKNCTAFFSVPYAEPPITGKHPQTGQMLDNRFKATVPLKRKWTSPLKVNKIGPSCIPTLRDAPFPKQISEDCLTLDIYIPDCGCKKKTVLVFIHGGAFAYGNTQYGPDYLLNEDCVVVLVQYRLGILGFLSLDCGDYTGNMGLKDQQEALKWIHKNIENFSGDKNQILLFGESAGGASTHFHMLNCESQKYFTRALCISSSAFCYYALNPAGNLDKIQKCTKIYDRRKLIEYLKTANSSELIKCYPYHTYDYTNITWAPKIESPSAPRAFQTKHPEDIYNSCEAPAMDAMFGINNEEGILFEPTLLKSTEPLIKKNLYNTTIQLPFRGFDKCTRPNKRLEGLQILKRAYYSDVTNAEIPQRNVDLLSDIVIREGTLKAAVYQTEANNEYTDECTKPNTYLFRFWMDSDINLVKVSYNWTYPGATHADDLCYYWCCASLRAKYLNHLKQKDQVYWNIKRMAKMIANFARTGDPSIDCDNPFIPNQSRDEMYCQEITNSYQSDVTYNIMDELHYEDWRKIEEISRTCTEY